MNRTVNPAEKSRKKIHNEIKKRQRLGWCPYYVGGLVVRENYTEYRLVYVDDKNYQQPLAK